jgi:hypothetical protein
MNLPLDRRSSTRAASLLGIRKLQDVESFSTMFPNYDLPGRRYVPYAYLYPFLETVAGVLTLPRSPLWVASPISLLFGAVGRENRRLSLVFRDGFV